MRGKLRDKRADTKRDILKREVAERKRMSKRDIAVWLDQQLEEEEDALATDEGDEAEIPTLPPAQPKLVKK
jgi:hypothetical protein